MSASPTNTSIRVLLLDIEGTTTPIDFVYEVLFPYARVRAAEFLGAHRGELQDEIEGLRRENADDVSDAPRIESPDRIDQISEYVGWLIDRDRKSTPLKSLQGKIWQAGYQAGDLRSQVFEDVPRAFERWRARGLRIGIYSSGSVLAQKLLFAHTEEGDLTRFIEAYFDTNTGAKKNSSSYGRIALSLKLKPPEILFVSDVTAELDAAAAAGFQTLLCRRPGNQPQPESKHQAISTFDEVF